MDQLGLAFTPRQLLVRPGQRIEFVNSETLAHNVHVSFADSDSTVFVADMDPADRREISLEREGGYDVTCDVHPGMRAFIFVTSAPYAVFAEADGSFRMPEVSPGSYTASVWSVSPALRGERAVEVSGLRDRAPAEHLPMSADLCRNRHIRPGSGGIMPVVAEPPRRLILHRDL